MKKITILAFILISILSFNTHSYSWDDISGGQIHDLGSKSASFSVNPALVRFVKFTAAGDLTLTLTPLTTGNQTVIGEIIVVQDEVGSNTVTVPLSSTVRTAGGAAISLAESANSVSVIAWQWIGSEGFYYLSVGSDISQ